MIENQISIITLTFTCSNPHLKRWSFSFKSVPSKVIYFLILCLFVFPYLSWYFCLFYEKHLLSIYRVNVCHSNVLMRDLLKHSLYLCPIRLTKYFFNSFGWVEIKKKSCRYITIVSWVHRKCPFLFI